MVEAIDSQQKKAGNLPAHPLSLDMMMVKYFLSELMVNLNYLILMELIPYL